jgi:hypothetical protein
MTDSTILRPLDPGEAFFFLTDRLSSMNFVVMAERAGALDPTRIAAALARLQADEGQLRLRIVWNDVDGLCFAQGDVGPLPLACEPCTEAAWMDRIAVELDQAFDTTAGPLLRCVHLATPDASRSLLALTFHHAIADGRSGTELLRRLLTLIAAGDDAVVPRPQAALPMYDLFPARFRWAEQEAAGEQLMDTVMADYKRCGRLQSWPALDAKAVGRRPRILRREVDEAAASRLLDRCRTEGTSLHGLLCAAQLIAQRHVEIASGRDAGERALFLSCPVDMRPHLEVPPAVDHPGLYVSILSSPFAVAGDSDPWLLARAAMAQTRTQLARGEAHLFFSMYGLEQRPVATDRYEPLAKAVQSSWQNTMLSNVGRIAPVAADPAVERISFALCPMPYQVVFNAASSYRGRVILNLGYDAARLPPENAVALADALIAVLLAA